jgi:hypothetical protein
MDHDADAALAQVQNRCSLLVKDAIDDLDFQKVVAGS